MIYLKTSFYHIFLIVLHHYILLLCRSYGLHFILVLRLLAHKEPHPDPMGVASYHLSIGPMHQCGFSDLKGFLGRFSGGEISMS